MAEAAAPVAPATPAAPTKPAAAPAEPKAKAAAPAPKEETRYDTAGNPIRARGGKPPDKEPEDPKPEPEPDGDSEEAEAADSAGDGEAREEAEEAETADAEAGGEEVAGDVPLGDETEFDIDGEKVPFKTLKELHKKAALTERRYDVAQRALNAIAADKERAVLDVFTSMHGGDGEKGYQELAGMTARVLHDAAQYDDIPEDLAVAAVSVVKKLAALEQMSPEAREALKLKRRAETAEQRAERLEDERRSEESNRRVESERQRIRAEIPPSLEALGIECNAESWDDLRYFLEKASYEGRSITVAQAAQEVKALYDKRNGTRSIRFEDIPEEFFERRRKLDVEKVRGAKPQNRPGTQQGATNGNRVKLPERRPTFG